MKPIHHNAAQQRIIAVLLALFGHEVHGLAPGDLAKALDEKPYTVTRDLANLRIAGIAEEMDGGRWRLTTRIPQRALVMLRNIERESERVGQIQQRYTRSA